MSKSKAWAYVLAGIQVINGMAAWVTYVASLDLPPGTKTHVLMANVGIAAITGGFQAFAKSLTDTDKDGIPDLFDDTPSGSTPSV